MTDEVRMVKRAWTIEPSLENEASLIRCGLRRGLIYDTNVVILAMLHHEPSLMAMDGSEDKIVYGAHVLKPKEPGDVIDTLTLWDRRVSIMVAGGVARELYKGRAQAVMDQAVGMLNDPNGIEKTRTLYRLGKYRGVHQVREILHSIIFKRRQHAIGALRQMYVTMKDKDFFEASWHYILPIALEGVLCA